MKPLEGIRILDLSHMLSGPTCTAMMALLGADVTKIERPGTGDGFRHYTEHAGKAGMSLPFAAANTGKKSITLNMKTPEAMEVVHKLAREADVVVENFRPGVPANLGLDWESLKKVNPKLVYCSITGFGSSGGISHWPALDQIVQAMSGLMWMNGEPDDGPVKIGFPALDTFTGYMAVIAILAALRRRDITGVGEAIDVSMIDCAMKFMGTTVATTLYTGELPPRTGNRGYRATATADLYPTADGYIMLGANAQPQWAKFCRIMGKPEWIDDPRFVDHVARVKHNVELRDALAEMMKDRSAAEVEAQLADAEVPAAMVRDLLQVIAMPRFKERGMFLDADLPEHDAPIQLLGAGFMMEGEPFTSGPVPTLGEHTDEVLAGLGYDAAAIQAMRGKGVF